MPRSRSTAASCARTGCRAPSCWSASRGCAARWSCAVSRTTWRRRLPLDAVAELDLQTAAGSRRRLPSEPRARRARGCVGVQFAPCQPASPHAASSSACPAASIPPSRRCCCKEHGCDVQGLFMSNWDDEDDAYCTAAQDFQDARAVAARARHPAAPGELRRASTASGCSSISCASSAPAARRTPTCCATARSSSASACDYVRAPRRARTSPPATTRASSTAPTAPQLLQGARRGQGSELFPARRAARAARARADAARRAAQGARCASAPAARACRCSTSPTAPASASSASARSASSSARFLAATPGPIESPDGEQLGHAPRAARSTRSASAAACRSAAAAATAEQPWYVAAKDAARNALIVVQGHDHPLLAQRRARPPGRCTGWRRRRAAPFRVHGKVRYRQADQAARFEPQPDGTRAHRFRRAAARRHARTVRGRSTTATLPRRRRHRAVCRWRQRSARRSRAPEQARAACRATPDIIRALLPRRIA